MKRFLAMAAAILLFLSTITTALAAMTPSSIDYAQIGTSIDRYMQEREAGLASCVVSVFDGEGILYEGYYGYADMHGGYICAKTAVDGYTKVFAEMLPVK
ncbi:MAG: hypothetical protein J6K73_16705 [Clostridia bacterium]|nr:hypothetical protein [Clostridia bacterium]MBP3651413.1 hypothetical protein [Clostridia bacterium]